MSMQTQLHDKTENIIRLTLNCPHRQCHFCKRKLRFTGEIVYLQRECHFLKADPKKENVIIFGYGGKNQYISNFE